MIGLIVLTGLQDCQDLQDFVIEETILLILRVGRRFLRAGAGSGTIVSMTCPSSRDGVLFSAAANFNGKEKVT